MPSEYSSRIVKSTEERPVQRLLVGTPTLGTVRMEWVQGRYGQLIPCNWSMVQMLHYVESYAPLGFMVPDAQNMIVKAAVEGDYEWLLFVEDDTIPPADAFMRFNAYMRDASVPVVSGLYYTKSQPSEPIVYRGRGNSYFGDWKPGDKVWADGVPTGCLLINVKVLKLMWDESPEYSVGGRVTRRVFEQPESMWFDAESQVLRMTTGTSDLTWCHRVQEQNVLGRAGWPKIAKRKYPFLVDTAIFCRHIDPSGRTYPM